MSNLTRVLGYGLLVLLLVSCDDPITAFRNSRQARAGLETAMSQLPVVAGFEIVKVVYQDFSLEGENRTCYYARAYSILGASQSETDAFESYVAALVQAGWQPVGSDFHRERALVRGVNENVLVHYGEPGVDIESAVDYTKLRIQYRSLIFVNTTYMVPRRQGC